MAAGTHIHPFGTTMGYCTTVNGSYTFFADLISTQVPDDEWTKSDNSDLSNARQELNTYGWVKQVDTEFTLYFVQSVYATIQTIFAAGTAYFWQVLYPTISAQSAGANSIWNGWISKRSQNKIEKLGDDKYQVTWTISKQGGVALTNGA